MRKGKNALHGVVFVKEVCTRSFSVYFLPLSHRDQSVLKYSSYKPIALVILASNSLSLVFLPIPNPVMSCRFLIEKTDCFFICIVRVPVGTVDPFHLSGDQTVAHLRHFSAPVRANSAAQCAYGRHLLEHILLIYTIPVGVQYAWHERPLAKVPDGRLQLQLIVCQAVIEV